MGFLDKLKQGLQRTTQQLVDKFDDIVQRADTAEARTRDVDVETAEALEEILLMADVGVAGTEQIVTAVTKRSRRGESLRELVKQEILSVLMAVPLEPDSQIVTRGKPQVLLVVGVNGVGKTTTIGKIANQQQQGGRDVLLAAGDTFRAAAAEQLGTWAERAEVPIVRGNEGGDPSAVVYDAIERASAREIPLVLADTAGRLHTKTNLMDELAKVRRVAEKGAGRVTEVLLVIDATTGQNGLAQARQFEQATQVTGVVLTKLDGSAKGGIVFAIQESLGIPVKLVGLGETVDDLVAFDPDEFVDALFSE